MKRPIKFRGRGIDGETSEYGFSVTARLVDNLPPKPKLRE